MYSSIRRFIQMHVYAVWRCLKANNYFEAIRIAWLFYFRKTALSRNCGLLKCRRNVMYLVRHSKSPQNSNSRSVEDVNQHVT
jgi:hypothetical protein